MAVTILPQFDDEQQALHAANATHALAEISPWFVQQSSYSPKSLEDYGLLLTVSEVQEALGIGRNSTYALIQSGKLKSIRVGKLIKVPRAALEEYLNSY